MLQYSSNTKIMFLITDEVNENITRKSFNDDIIYTLSFG